MNSVYVHVLTPVLAAGLVNALSFSRKLPITKYKNPWIPPGPIVGLVWLVLLGLLGYVHFKLYKKAGNEFSEACLTIVVFVLYCLAYPLLTSLSPNPMVGVFLNIVALGFALFVTLRVFAEDSTLLPYMIPLLGWTSYVNIVTV
jgi:tryptophan-rich sensory protein